MNSSVTLGRILGIEIGVHWSWLAVFALIVWSLATTVFPDQNPGLSDSAYLSMAVVASILFFTSLLLHELGHAIEARREGMTIEGITLWLFGGVAKFSGMFPSAGAEFRIAIAGPLVSLLLGAGFVGVAVVLSGAEQVDGVAAWLGYINLALLVFNLLPALPLDGGRILRSALWALRNDFAFATRVASSIGRGFGFLFIAGGLALFFWASATSGLWLALLGWFLLGAAAGEARAGVVQEALAGFRVRDVMVRQPTTVAPDQTIGDLLDGVVWTHRYTTYPVVENGLAVGLLPFRSVAAIPRREWDERSVRDSMLPLSDVPVLSADEPLDQALTKLGEDVGRGLVVEDGRLVGLLSISDVARHIQSRAMRGAGRRWP